MIFVQNKQYLCNHTCLKIFSKWWPSRYTFVFLLIKYYSNLLIVKFKSLNIQKVYFRHRSNFCHVMWEKGNDWNKNLTQNIFSWSNFNMHIKWMNCGKLVTTKQWKSLFLRQLFVKNVEKSLKPIIRSHGINILMVLYHVTKPLWIRIVLYGWR